MATKKKPAPKKASKPAPKKKPVAKKPVAKVAKPATKPTAKAVKKPAVKKSVAAKKPAPKPASKPAPKAVAKPTPKPVSKPAPTPAPAPKVEAPKPVAKKGGVDPKSLVSIKQKVQPVVKKEPPKPAKVVMPKISTKSAVKYEPDFTKSVLDASPVVHDTTPVMRYSDTDLTEFREIIQRKLDAAKKELSYLQGLITRKDEGGDMDEARYITMEAGSVSMERDQLSQKASRQITFIDHLEKALMRIENKTYGICRVTGKLIDKARLRAVPHATLSMEAKEKRTN